MRKIVLIFIGILIAACSKDDVVSNNENTQDKLFIDKIINYQIIDGVEKETTTTYYTYTNNLVSKIETKTDLVEGYIDVKEEFNYIDGNVFSCITKINYPSIDNKVGEISHYFHYNSGLITSSTYNDHSGVFKNTYLYDASNNLSLHKEFYDYGRLNMEYKYEYYSNGNIKNRTGTRISGVYENKPDTFIYDEMENPFYKIYPIEYCKIYKISKNNIISSDSYTYEYKYNDKKYPIRKVTKSIYGIEKIEVFVYK